MMKTEHLDFIFIFQMVLQHIFIVDYFGVESNPAELKNL